MLHFIQKQEQHRAGVAGPFLQGADLLAKTFDEWLAEWQAPAEFDIRAWFLETLRTSSRETDKPHFISLEFFAHELFCCDAPCN
jgi:3-phenylpropionate/cinnamic acid dioxygenase small subunit